MDVGQLLSLGGPLVVLAVVIGYLLVSNRADREQHQDNLAAAVERIKALEDSVRALNKDLDHERGLRREAENRSAAALREAADTRAELVILTRRVNQAGGP